MMLGCKEGSTAVSVRTAMHVPQAFSQSISQLLETQAQNVKLKLDPKTSMNKK